jgi:two-component system, NarL family, response regulator
MGTCRDVYRGARRIQRDVAMELAQRCDDASLTKREVQVLHLAATGNSNKRIAARLNINEETAKTHMRSILAKLNAGDRAHAVMLGLRRGIIALQP